MSRIRCFALSSYLSESQIMSVILSRNIQIQYYAYAYHDKDTFEEGNPRAGELKEPHFHIILYTFNAHSVSAVARWFSGFRDDDGILINTFAEQCYDRFQLFDYLDHSNAPDKYQYPHSIITSNNFPFFEGKDDDLDTGNMIIEGMKSGLSYEVLRKRFGTHFILNYNKYKLYLEEELCLKKFDITNNYIFDVLKEKHIAEINLDLDSQLDDDFLNLEFSQELF